MYDKDHRAYAREFVRGAVHGGGSFIAVEAGIGAVGMWWNGLVGALVGAAGGAVVVGCIWIVGLVRSPEIVATRKRAEARRREQDLRSRARQGRDGETQSLASLPPTREERFDILSRRCDALIAETDAVFWGWAPDRERVVAEDFRGRTEAMLTGDLAAPWAGEEIESFTSVMRSLPNQRPSVVVFSVHQWLSEDFRHRLNASMVNMSDSFTP